MRYQILYIPTILILMIFFVTGCQKTMVKISSPEDIPDLVQNDDGESLLQEDTAQQDSMAQNDESYFVPQSSLVEYPASIEQLQSAIRGMEAFRLFSYYVLLKKDTKTCAE